MRRTISNATWAEIRTAYASGIGLREIARHLIRRNFCRSSCGTSFDFVTDEYYGQADQRTDGNGDTGEHRRQDHAAKALLRPLREAGLNPGHDGHDVTGYGGHIAKADDRPAYDNT